MKSILFFAMLSLTMLSCADVNRDSIIALESLKKTAEEPPETDVLEPVASCSLKMKKNGVVQEFAFIISPLSSDACRIRENMTLLTIMDTRNWGAGISFEGNKPGEFELNGSDSQPNLVTVNVGMDDYMSSLKYGMLFITEFTEDKWITGNFLGFTGENEDIEVSGKFTIQAK